MEGNAYDPLEVFPLPVWECILEQLRMQGSSGDVLNCSKVCTEFHWILEPTKREWLFGAICPFILPYLKGSELLACRMVCKNWCRGVDKFLKDFETWRPFDEGTSDISRSTQYDPLQPKGIKWTCFKDEQALEVFLEEMENQKMKTPFVGRSVSLGDRGGFECRGIESNFFEKALELLSLYGDHIWHLRVVPTDDFDSCHFYQILKHILACTPHLKSLILDLRYPDSCPFQDAIKLKNLCEDHSGISLLETLEIYTSSTPIIILEKLISKFNLGNLRCLKLHYNFPYTGEQHVVVTPLQHLTELHVSGFHWLDLEHIFNNMISPTAPLGKICWEFPGDFVKMEVDFDRMCHLINRWKTTLRILSIKGCHKEPRLSLSKLEAPNLKSLELEEITFGTDFLPPLVTASLEYLRIRFIYSCRPVIGPGKRFEQDELHDSSIWGEMKKLKVIQIESPFSEDWDGGGTQKLVCTRQMHELGIPPKVVVLNYFPPWMFLDDSNYNYNDSDDDDFDDYFDD